MAPRDKKLEQKVQLPEQSEQSEQSEQPEQPEQPDHQQQAKPTIKVGGRVNPMWHPFQNRWIGLYPVGDEVILDNWVECQIEGGLLLVIEES